MSTGDLKDLKDLAKKVGAELGWKAFGEAVDVDGETLRQFAQDPERDMQPANRRRLRAYFSLGPLRAGTEAARDALRVLTLLRDAVRTQEQLVRQIGEIAEVDAGLDDPLAGTTPTDTAGGRPAPGRRKAGGK